MNYSPKEIEMAAQDLEECASTWCWGRGRLSSRPVNESEGLPRVAYNTVCEAWNHFDLLTNDDYDEDTDVTCMLLEAAQLLREGWLPGDELVRL